MTLTLCTACRRHVRVLEPSCPFCGGTLEVARRSVPLPRLGRAALLAFGTTLAVSACGSSSTSTDQGGESGENGSGGESDPTSPTNPGTPPSQPGPDDGGVVAAYGAPAPHGPTP